MLEVRNMPQSDQEDDDEDDDEEEDKEDEEEEVEEQAEDDASKEPEEFDEGKTQKEISDRMEAVRLNKALGNDSDDAELDYDTESSSESEESDSDADSDDSVGPAPTEFSSFDQNRKNRRPAAAPKAKGLTRADELKLTVAQQVGKERDQTAKKHHSKKSVNKAGNAKGHKWKQSEAFQVGKNSGW
jgi:RIO kinase 2